MLFVLDWASSSRVSYILLGSLIIQLLTLSACRSTPHLQNTWKRLWCGVWSCGSDCPYITKPWWTLYKSTAKSCRHDTSTWMKNSKQLTSVVRIKIYRGCYTVARILWRLWHCGTDFHVRVTRTISHKWDLNVLFIIIYGQ